MPSLATAKLGRNDACPCGSGSKVKRCHDFLVGEPADGAAWYLDTLAFIEGCEGYVPPMSLQDRQTWAATGCPFGYCPHETEGVSCAAGCGV